MTEISLPREVRHILETLEKAGYEAYAVGGCVRDALLGREPNDWDVTTSAKPEQVKELFSHTFDTGIAHGTVSVLLGNETFEVTTYRIDGPYEDARHPSSVIFTPDLREDLRRRDFTINAMAYSDRTGIVDLFDGRGDLERKVIRAVGKAEERFEEDALRILRAVRFAAQLNFELDPDTAAAARELAGNLSKISAERIETELEKLLISDHPELLRTAWELGITAVILPEFDRCMAQPQNNAHHIYSAGEHTLVALANIDAEKALRWTMLFHDLGKPEVVTIDENGTYHFRGHAKNSAVIAKKIMKRLKFDNDTMRTVQHLVGNHSMYPIETEEGVRRSINEIGEKLFPLFLKVKRSDILAQSPEVQEKKLVYLDHIVQIYRGILERGECTSLAALAIGGDDLMQDGMERGREIGDMLKKLLDEVLAHPEYNKKELLIEKSRQIRGL